MSLMCPSSAKLNESLRDDLSDEWLRSTLISRFRQNVRIWSMSGGQEKPDLISKPCRAIQQPLFSGGMDKKWENKFQ